MYENKNKNRRLHKVKKIYSSEELEKIMPQYKQSFGNKIS